MNRGEKNQLVDFINSPDYIVITDTGRFTTQSKQVTAAMIATPEIVEKRKNWVNDPNLGDHLVQLQDSSGWHEIDQFKYKVAKIIDPY